MSSFVPAGLCPVARFEPSDKSPGYFLSSLRDCDQATARNISSRPAASTSRKSSAAICPPARRAKDNSPAIYRWDSGSRGAKSRRDERLQFFRPCGTLLGRAIAPSDKSLGYFLSSLRDWSTATHRLSRWRIVVRDGGKIVSTRRFRAKYVASMKRDRLKTVLPTHW